MNNKFKGLYDTEGTSFISDKVEPINYYEPAIKTPRIQNHTYSINFDKTELYKEIEKLQQELQRKDNNWNELKKYVDKLYESETYHSIGEVLDKMEEIENGK